MGPINPLFAGVRKEELGEGGRVLLRRNVPSVVDEHQLIVKLSPKD